METKTISLVALLFPTRPSRLKWFHACLNESRSTVARADWLRRASRSLPDSIPLMCRSFFFPFPHTPRILLPYTLSYTTTSYYCYYPPNWYLWTDVNHSANFPLSWNWAEPLLGTNRHTKKDNTKTDGGREPTPPPPKKKVWNWNVV